MAGCIFHDEVKMTPLIHIVEKRKGRRKKESPDRRDRAQQQNDNALLPE
jgi:hypothetical protein